MKWETVREVWQQAEESGEGGEIAARLWSDFNADPFWETQAFLTPRVWGLGVEYTDDGPFYPQDDRNRTLSLQVGPVTLAVTRTSLGIRSKTKARA